MNSGMDVQHLLAQSASVGTWLFRKQDATDLVTPTDQVFMIILLISSFAFILLMALMMYFVVVYRRKPGVAAERSARHNTALEIAWTLVPSLALVVMFFDGFWVYIQQAVAPGESLVMDLTAYKWNWEVRYPNGAVSTETTKSAALDSDQGGLAWGDYPVFYMPANTPVKLKMNSKDVMHSFYVPDFRVKFDVMPNRYTNIWFKANDPEGGRVLPATHPTLPGVEFEDHWVFCAEYCGEKHSEMAAIIRVVPPAAYEKWVAANVMDMSGDPVAIGKKLYVAKGCNACHSVDGSKNVGPSWLNMYGEEQMLTDGSKVIADDNYLRESILVPAAKIVAGYPNQMPSYQGQLNDLELAALLAYMRSISTHAGPAPAAAEEAAEGVPAAAPKTSDAPENNLEAPNQLPENPARPELKPGNNAPTEPPGGGPGPG